MPLCPSSFMNSFHNSDLLFCQPMELVDQGVWWLVASIWCLRASAQGIYGPLELLVKGKHLLLDGIRI